MTTLPMNAAEFATLMARTAPWDTPLHLAVAVSGGADSMALTLLAHDWTRERGGQITALTVDHGLRQGSAQEAAQVHAWLIAAGISHHMLAWEGKKPTANIQAMARHKRYELLTTWCRAHRVHHLLLAHHLDDQAETLLMRLARGSGVDGLSAMPLATTRQGVRILRPLLSVPRERLRATLQARGQEWIEDPSNQDPRHDRSRLRAALEALEDYPLLRARLAATAQHMSRARCALEAQTAAAMRTLVAFRPPSATLDLDGWRELEPEIALRILAELIRTIGGHAYRPRLASLTRLARELRTEGFDAARTLGGCVWKPSRKKNQSHMLTISPEPTAQKSVKI